MGEVSKEFVEAFVRDVTPGDLWPGGEESQPKRRGGRRRQSPLVDEFSPPMPMDWVVAAHFARANLTAAMLLWRLSRLWRNGPRFPVSTGRIADELRCTKQAVRQTWTKLEKAGLITIHERRPGRRLIIEINEEAGCGAK